MRGRLSFLIVSLLVAVGLCGSSVQAGSTAASGVSAKIVFVDVEQGDGVVMRVGGQVIVSDAGEHRAATVDATLRSLGAKQIDVAILSHPHDNQVRNSTGR